MTETTPRHERRWSASHLPTTLMMIERTRLPGYDFTAAMKALCEDIAARMPEFRHLDMSRVMITAAFIRKKTRYGVQARVTPMRFVNGSLTTRKRNRLYGIERYYVSNVEILYLLTFVMPRFLAQSFEEKVATVIHELYHMSEAFDGDIRRLPGRCSAHSHSKEQFHDGMRRFAEVYLKDHDNPAVFEFLKWSYKEYQARFGGLNVIVVPRPRMVPLTRAEC